MIPLKHIEDIGLRWARKEIDLEEFGFEETKIIKFTEKQKEFFNARERFVLAVGGFASGKTTALIAKLVFLALAFPNNLILLGRKYRQTIYETMLPDLFDFLPSSIYKFYRNIGKIEFVNGSEIIIMGLDVLAGQTDNATKKALAKIKSMNLGAVCIDQLEEIDYKIFKALDGRLRRKVGFNQMVMTANPENHWSYEYFKLSKRPNTRLIEGFNMYDIKDYLPKEFIVSQESKDEKYVRKYVQGIWEVDTITENQVFTPDELQFVRIHIREPKTIENGIKIWQEPENNYTYQVGVDVSEGAEDPSSIKVFCKETGEEVASFTGFVEIDVLKDKLLYLLQKYSPREKAFLVPEVNGPGLALLNLIKKDWNNIYEREVFEYRTKRRLKKLGFYTSVHSKQVLLGEFKKLLRANALIIREKETLEEMLAFSYIKGTKVGATGYFHDDRVMATMLATFGIKPRRLQMKQTQPIKKPTVQNVSTFEYI